MCVTRRLVAIGGGWGGWGVNKLTFTALITPEERGGLGVSARRFVGGGKWREKLSLFWLEECVLLGKSICMFIDMFICVHLSSHSLPQPAVQCPVCRHC